MTAFKHCTVDGNVVDLSAGASAGQILGYDGTKIVAIANRSTAIYWNPIVEANYTAGASGAGNYTMGCSFAIGCNATLTGLQFIFPDAVARTIRFRAWFAAVAQVINSGGLTYYEQVLSTPGTYIITFPVPLAIAPHKVICVSYWHTAGTRYYQFVPPSSKRPPNNTNNQSGPNFAWIDSSIYAAGDTVPSTANAPYAASVCCPIFTIP